MALYAWPAAPEGSDVVVIVRAAGAMVRDRVALTLCGAGVAESVTLRVTLLVLGPVGVPLMTPEELMERPAGSPVADQVYGGVPPPAATVMLYAWPVAPEVSDVVVIVSGPEAIFNVRVTVAVCGVGVVESVALMITLPLLAAVGVPVIAPVPALIERPAGRPVADQVYGAIPPVAAMVML